MRVPTPDVEKILVNRIHNTVYLGGLYSGKPCTVLTLQGCSVRCSYCHVPDTFDAKPINRVQVHEQKMQNLETFAAVPAKPLADLLIQTGGEQRRWLLVVTGGEPLEQSDALAELLWMLSENSKRPEHVLIETSGCGCLTRFTNRSTFRNMLHFCLSPKVGVGKHDTPLTHPANTFDSMVLTVSTESDMEKYMPYLERHPNAFVIVRPIKKMGMALSEEARLAAIKIASDRGWVIG